jgi:hypothetical protein
MIMTTYEAQQQIARILKALEAESGQVVLDLRLDNYRVHTIESAHGIEYSRVQIQLSRVPGDGWPETGI